MVKLTKGLSSKFNIITKSDNNNKNNTKTLCDKYVCMYFKYTKAQQILRFKNEVNY